MLWVCAKYYICELICDVISCCIWTCDMAKINVGLYENIMIENQNKKIRNHRKLYTNLHLIDGLRIEFTADARGIADIIYRWLCDAYRYFVVHA